MDRGELQRIFERLDNALSSDAVLHIRGGAAVLALGLDLRVTLDIDVLPGSRFVDAETLVLPRSSDEVPYNTVFRGRRLTVKTPPASDLVIGKLKRLEPEDLADVAFLIRRFGLTRADLEESAGRLPARFLKDPVVQDNLRYILEDYL